MEALEEFNKRCEVLKKISKICDINRVKAGAKVKDLLPDYNGELENWAVGIFLQNARSKGDYKCHAKYETFLSSIGFTFENVVKRHTLSYILKAIDDLHEAGHDLNNIPTDAMLSHYLPQYKEDDIKIGRTLSHAKMGRVGAKVTERLAKYKFNFDKKIVTRVSVEEKVRVLKLLQEKGFDLNDIPPSKKLGDYIILGDEEDYEVGDWIRNYRDGKTGEELNDEFKKLGIIIPEKKFYQSARWCISLLESLVFDLGVDLNQIPETAMASDYFDDFKFNDFKIGEILNRAKYFPSYYQQEFIEGLRYLGVNIKQRFHSKEEKYDIIKKLVDSGVDINKIQPEETADQLAPEIYKGAPYPVGKWIKKEKEKDASWLLRKLIELGLNYNKRHYYSVDLKLRVFAQLIKKGIDINLIQNDDKISTYFHKYKEDYPIGQWLMQVERGGSDKNLVVGLRKLGYKFTVERYIYCK